MIPQKVKEILKKQHYALVGKHSAVQICRWTKKSLRNEGVCYKEKFYGIKSHLCCQMSPAIMWCQNKCIHCWRAVEFTIDNELKGEIDSPKEIIDGCILAQRKLLEGFNIDSHSKKKQLSKADMKKYQEAQEPMQFAISLSGEPTLYEKIGDLIEELRKRGKTSFLVTNGLYPEKLKEIERKNQLPTQLYVSVNTPNKEIYIKFHRSSLENAWERFNETLIFLSELRGKTRTIFRMNLILKLNMEKEHAKEYALLIQKSKPLFVELKGFMSVGFARQRLGYERMPKFEDIFQFSKLLSEELKKIGEDYQILDSHEFSRVIVLGKDKKDLKIKKSEE
jgi:tRNA wybutosine-synthesizing protein 1